MNSFEKLSDTFGVDNSIEVIEDSKNLNEKIVATLNGQKYTIEDIEYMKTELMNLIETNRKVLDELGNCCKVGAPPRMFEVFATLSSTLAANIAELAKLEQAQTNYQVIETKEEMARESMNQKERLHTARIANESNKGQEGPTLIQNNTYNLTSKELLKMIKSAQENALINTQNIKPEFDLE